MGLSATFSEASLKTELRPAAVTLADRRDVCIGAGVMRHADAGYDIAIDCAREKGLDLPMAGK
jgi:urocanate hydratase